MHVIAGKYKGRKLVFKKSSEVRPLTQKVREALFNIMGDRICDKIMLDLFCGSGSAGIEALSRGASHVDFVDLDVTEVTTNKNVFKLDDQVSIYRQDALRALDIIQKKDKHYDIIFVGAPYKYSKLSEILKKIDCFGILQFKGLLIIEHQKGILIDCDLINIQLTRIYPYGQTILKLFERKT